VVIVRDGFCLGSLRTSYFFSIAKKSSQKMPLAAKVFNRTKRLSLWGQLDFLEAQLRPVAQLDKEVEIVTR
jgi:hypothetical protein